MPPFTCVEINTILELTKSPVKCEVEQLRIDSETSGHRRRQPKWARVNTHERSRATHSTDKTRQGTDHADEVGASRTSSTAMNVSRLPRCPFQR